jgi:DnaK suppressor protein
VTSIEEPAPNDMRERLLADREETQARAAAMSQDLDHVVAAASLVATDDEHDPEGSTIAFDRAQLIAVLDQAHQHLGELDQALARLEDGSYGSCTRCGGSIGMERLVARPAAATCIVCASLPSR